MPRLPLESIVEARIAGYRERALSNFPQHARHQRSLLPWNRRNHRRPQPTHSTHAQLASTHGC
jgi:hypothetical protein